ncbi:MAG: hypothetical protein JNK53_02210 [Phycisphaerae bacterium]|nr:hypothetical protein [Phycisphaerae bacterium]
METIRALMHEIVDYAGLFPPASLDMPKTVTNFGAYFAGPDAWALGRLVMPINRLGEFERYAETLLPKGARDDTENPWKITGLSAATGDDEFETELNIIDKFNERHNDSQSGRAIIDAIELKTTSANAIEQALEMMPDTLFPWFEVPISQDNRGMLAALSEMESGAKIRTGGVTADAHPTPLAVARFLVHCAAADVPFKATAGLHHPFRRHAPEVGCHQFGFVNLFIGAALHFHGQVEQEELEMLLIDEHPGNFEFHQTQVSWKGRSIGIGALREARERFARSFGSCSFDEPMGDLRALHLLPAAAAPKGL